jgi:hypothetical protein
MKKTIALILTSLFALNVNSQNKDSIIEHLVKKERVLEQDLDSLEHSIEKTKNRLKISGWVQFQYQHTDTAGAKNFDGGDFPTNSNNRFMIRRGRVKFSYTEKNILYVFQLNASERGVNIVEIYGKITDKWTKSFSLQTGIINRPFGFEIQQSSSERASPERSRWTQTFMPNERDLGAMLTFQPTAKQKLSGLKIDAGFFNGTGIAVSGTGTSPGSAVGTTGVNGFTDFDKYKDFIGHIVYYKTVKKNKFGVGFSHYNGGFAYQNNKVYNSISTDSTGSKVWNMADTTTKKYKNGLAPRVYYGVEGFVNFKTKLGTTIIRGEYFWGTQTGRDVDTRSPQATPGITDAMYVRSFNAGYIYLIQKILNSKHDIVFKYEWYDPNTKISNSDLNGINGMKQGDIKYTCLGVGYNIAITEQVKFMLHYNMVHNEITKIKGYTYDLKDNVLTVRMQYRF